MPTSIPWIGWSWSSILVAVMVIPSATVLWFKHDRNPSKRPHLFKTWNGKKWKLLPGPTPIPILGNLHEMFKARQNANDLSNYLTNISEYGELTTLQLGTKTWVLLNSNRVITEIIAKRGGITTGRLYQPIASGLVSRGKRSLLRPIAEWTEDRRVMHNLLHGPALKSYGDLHERESIKLLASYLFRPEKWYSHHYRYSNSVVHQIVLGKRLLNSTPELQDFGLVTAQFIGRLNASVIDFFPYLSRLPKLLQPWRRHWEDMGKFHYDTYQKWWKPVKVAISNGTAPPSFVRDALLNGAPKSDDEDEEAMYLALGVFAAGSDNTRMTLNILLMALLCHPQVLEKARDEIDNACGADAQRLPSLNDLTKMPYVNAMIKEILRWRPLVPLIPQHQLTEDLDFEGCHFPKGTDFVINLIAVSQGAEVPEDSRPERWLDGNEFSITHLQWQFGGGRRICVGCKVAQQGLFLVVSRLCYYFDFVAAGSYDSRKLRHESRDEPFPVKVTVRSEAHKRLIVYQADTLGYIESAKEDF